MGYSEWDGMDSSQPQKCGEITLASRGMQWLVNTMQVSGELWGFAGFCGENNSCGIAQIP